MILHFILVTSRCDMLYFRKQIRHESMFRMDYYRGKEGNRTLITFLKTVLLPLEYLTIMNTREINISVPTPKLISSQHRYNNYIKGSFNKMLDEN